MTAIEVLMEKLVAAGKGTAGTNLFLGPFAPEPVTQTALWEVTASPAGPTGDAYSIVHVWTRSNGAQAALIRCGEALAALVSNPAESSVLQGSDGTRISVRIGTLPILAWRDESGRVTAQATLAVAAPIDL
jgi:hypothetical protein